MQPKKLQRLPFLLIVSFSLLVMAAIVLAQNESKKSITLLKKENLQALKTIQVDNTLGHIINDIYAIDENVSQYLISKDQKQFKSILDTIVQLQNDVQKIKLLANVNNSSIHELGALIDRKIAPLKQITDNSNKSEKEAISSTLASAESLLLTDSIYSSALTVQYELETNLHQVIQENHLLTSRVFFTSWVLGITSILAIVILASIIISRLLQNYRLINELGEATAQIEKQSLVKEQFLANMSHEIRTPINSVIGFTNLLEKTQMESNQQQFVGLIKTAGQNLLGIVNDILDISKIEAGMLHFDKNPFNIVELCYTMEMMFYHQFTEKKLTCDFSVAPDVPPIIIGDKERLAQILNNLINNAIKFTNEGGVTLLIEVVNKAEKKATLRFTVKDTGIGIAPDKVGKVFQRFEQAESDTTRNYGGTGLGLSIVKSLVDLQGGSICAVSETGKGSQFILEIEFGIEEADALTTFITASPKNLIQEQNPMALQNVRILVAEDNKMNQMLLNFVLDQWKLQYEIVENGQEAVNKLKHQEYDLVLMDIQMPVMDGYTATECIRNQLKLNVPVIAMTANVLPGEKEKCKKAGMNDYLSKPINENILYDLLVLYTSQNNNSDTGQQPPQLLIDRNYLNRIFSGNEDFIKEIIEQFLLQFPKELDDLEQAVTNRDIKKVRQISHHMKTTLSTVNNRSLLLEDLGYLEVAEDSSTYWDIVNHKMRALSQSRQQLNA